MTRTATHSTSVVDKAIDDFLFLDAPRSGSPAYNRTNRTPTRQVPNQLRLRDRKLPNVKLDGCGLDDYTVQQIMDIAPDTCLDQAPFDTISLPLIFEFSHQRPGMKFAHVHRHRNYLNLGCFLSALLANMQCSCIP
jgi:hypothetical protein